MEALAALVAGVHTGSPIHLRAGTELLSGVPLGVHRHHGLLDLHQRTNYLPTKSVDHLQNLFGELVLTHSARIGGKV